MYILKNIFITLIITFFTPLTINGADHIVKMLNQNAEGVMVFEPSYLKVAVGDTVTFKSIDPAHNSASLEGMIPPGASSWNSQLSQDITVKLDVEGIYAYQCTPHSMMAMVGVIQVGDDISNLDDLKSKAASIKSKFIMNQNRLDVYLSKISN
mgnify:CR=1 FL=1|tara:strand:- start:3864 stop:4322 length:459 start_codon:yes stop_codon:yes gene_type:complete